MTFAFIIRILSLCANTASFYLTHMCEEHVIFPSAFLRRQHLLTWCPSISKVEELPLVLVTLDCLQIFLLPIERSASHSLLKSQWHVPLCHYHTFVYFKLCNVQRNHSNQMRFVKDRTVCVCVYTYI